MFDSQQSSSSEAKLRVVKDEMISRNSSNMSTPSPINNGRYMKKKKDQMLNNDKSFESDFMSDLSSEKL